MNCSFLTVFVSFIKIYTISKKSASLTVEALKATPNERFLKGNLG